MIAKAPMDETTKHILLVEDEPAHAHMVCRAFEKHENGYRITVAVSLTEARDFLTRFSPDLVIIDFQLPDGKGTELLESENRMPDFPVVVVTGYGTEQIAVNAMKVGALDYVSKSEISLMDMPNIARRALHEWDCIIDRRRKEQNLKASEQKLKSIIDSVPDIIYQLDSAGRITFISEAVKDLLGYSQTELVGTSMLELVHHDDRQNASFRINERRNGGDRNTRVFEFRALRKDKVPVNILITTAEGLYEGRRFKGTLGIAKDITALRRTERALRESEEKYRLLVENANDAIFIAQDEVIKFPNPRTLEITGYSTEELIKIPFVNLIHPDYRSMVFERHLNRLRGKNPPSTYSFRIINRAGNKLWVQLNTAPITWEGRAATINFLRDISEQKRLKSRIEAAQRMEAIGTLAGGIAHDFNNILSVIIGYTEIASFQVDDASEVKTSLNQVLKAGKRARNLVSQILSFSKQADGEPNPTEIIPIVKEVLKLLKATFPTTIEIRLHLASDVGIIAADPTRIHQIVMNLCTNARYAMRDKGGVLEVTLAAVELSARKVAEYHDLKPGSYLKLSVRDTGCGMDRNTLKQIFDPYFTTREKGEGTGLGLAVVHGIVTGCNGMVIAESEPEKGSVFHVYLPRVDLTEESPPAELKKAIPTGSEQILYIDDEQIIADMGKQMLDHLGYHVMTCTNSNAALELFRAHADRFDLIITDMTMPNMTGLELSKELMRIRQDIPIILCTGFSEHISAETAKKAGIQKFLMKPLTIKDLAFAVRKLIDKKSKT